MSMYYNTSQRNKLNGGTLPTQHMNLLHAVYPTGGKCGRSCPDGTSTSAKGIPWIEHIRRSATSLTFEAYESTGLSKRIAASKASGAKLCAWEVDGFETSATSCWVDGPDLSEIVAELDLLDISNKY